MPKNRQPKSAVLYRMVTPDHVCPFGLKSKDLLQRRGYEVEDHHLKTREETDAFMEKHGVDTTPQAFIDGECIGGYDDLLVHFGIDPQHPAESDTRPRVYRAGGADHRGGDAPVFNLGDQQRTQAATVRSLNSKPNATRRRALLAVGALAVAGWVYGVPRLASLWPSRLTYRDLDGLVPFRELVGAGAVSSGNGMLVGLEQTMTTDVDHATRMAAVRADPCTALFGHSNDPRIPVAFFSDFNCPNCRVLEAILADYQTANPGVLRIIRFELPLLGAASITASKAVLAAERQGAYAAMQDRLTRSRMVTDLNLVQAFAENIGLDGPQLVADMQRPEIDMVLDQARAIAAVFGFYGTPATVIGHTAFLGVIPAADVTRIIAAEQERPPLPCQKI